MMVFLMDFGSGFYMKRGRRFVPGARNLVTRHELVGITGS